MKKHLFTLMLLFSVFLAFAQSPTPTLTLSIADANMLPTMKPSTAHYKVDRVYGQNLQTEYYFKYGVPTSALSPFLASLHLNITSIWVDPVSGVPVQGYWTSEKVYSALVNTIDFSKSMTHLVTAADIFKSDSTRIALDSLRLNAYQTAMTAALSNKFDTPNGTSTQFINGKGELVSLQYLTDSTLMVVTQKFVSKDSVYNNPTWIGYLDYGTKLQNKPNLSVYETTSHASATYYPLTNPSGYISSVPAQSFASLTGKPTTLSGYGITDGVTTASLSSTLSNYVLTSTYTSGLAAKQNLITLTTTGSGASTFNQSTGALNIPTPTVNTYTAGTGISIASNVITNTAPYVVPVISTPTLVLGTSYQAPANKNVWVNASITHTIALTLVLSSGSSLVQLQTSPNGTTWTTINSSGYSDGVAVAVALTKTVTNNVSGEVAPSQFYRLLATTSGAGTAAITNQQLKTY